MKIEAKYRILGTNLLVALAMTLMLNLSFFLLREQSGRNHDYPSIHIWVQVFYLFLVSWVTVTFNTIKNWGLVQRILVSLIAICLFYALTPIFSRGTGEWNIQFNSHKLFSPFHVTRMSFVWVVGVLYGMIYDLIYQKQFMTIENERLKNENLQTRYNLLANQLSPHFLFNSLNSLTLLVREGSTERALHYIDRLSDTFRYTLQSGKNELTTLSEELRFTEAYLYLLSIRYEDKLFWEVDIDENYLGWQLPAMSLMPLIENAVKHNAITSSKPFRIVIRTQGDALEVSNPLLPKIESAAGTGIGLKNLSQRYQLLLDRSIQVVNDGSSFTVVLPLIQPE